MSGGEFGDTHAGNAMPKLVPVSREGRRRAQKREGEKVKKGRTWTWARWTAVACAAAMVAGCGTGPQIAPGGGHYLAESYGPGAGKRPRPHQGEDYSKPRGSKVFAAAAGEAVLVNVHYGKEGRGMGCGNGLSIFHTGEAEGLLTKYCHLGKVHVREGQSVERGQVIGTVGDSGCGARGCDTHLHFEVWDGSRHVRPKSKISGCLPLEEGGTEPGKPLTYPVQLLTTGSGAARGDTARNRAKEPGDSSRSRWHRRSLGPRPGWKEPGSDPGRGPGGRARRRGRRAGRERSRPARDRCTAGTQPHLSRAGKAPATDVRA